MFDILSALMLHTCGIYKGDSHDSQTVTWMSPCKQEQELMFQKFLESEQEF